MGYGLTEFKLVLQKFEACLASKGFSTIQPKLWVWYQSVQAKPASYVRRTKLKTWCSLVGMDVGDLCPQLVLCFLSGCTGCVGEQLSTQQVFFGTAAGLFKGH